MGEPLNLKLTNPDPLFPSLTFSPPQVVIRSVRMVVGHWLLLGCRCRRDRSAIQQAFLPPWNLALGGQMLESLRSAPQLLGVRLLVG